MVSRTSLPLWTVEKYKEKYGWICSEKINSIKIIHDSKTGRVSSSHSYQITTENLMIILPLQGQNTAAHQLLNVTGQAIIQKLTKQDSRSQWPCGLNRRTAAACLLRSWVRIPPGAWTFVCCECSVLSGRGLCDELITCPEEFYRLRCVVVCDLETSRIGAPYIYIWH